MTSAPGKRVSHSLHSTKAPTAALPDVWRHRVTPIWIVLMLVLGGVAAAFVASLPYRTIAEVFLLRQDLGPGLSSLALFVLIALPAFKFGPGVVRAIEAAIGRGSLPFALSAAALVAVGAYAGWTLVYQAYPLSMDEVWAVFDAHVFEHGRALAPAPAEWRSFLPAMAPRWRIHVPGNAAWASTYLPMNAVLRAAFGRLGSQALAGPFWAALSILLVHSLARQFWPERRDAAVVAVLLLATSSQLIVTAMTPYAMSAHLALNLLWLWLFLRRGARAQGGAMAVAFVATGLHQFVFHPMFAAPFVLQLWLTRRWRMAVAHTLAYGVICVFWMAWWPLLFAALGLGAYGVHAAAGGATTEAMRLAFTPLAPGMMAENLLRLILWQNPLTIPLALLSLGALRGRLAGPLPPLAAGAILMTLLLLLVTPFQGHGWGYRYLHGYLGSFCLLAASAWVDLTARPETRGRAWAVLAATTACAMILWLPLRLSQVRAFIDPYARAWSVIAAAPADVVIVDTPLIPYSDDLVRNDPDLNAGPKVMHRLMLTHAQILDLCARYRVAWFDRPAALAVGLRPAPGRTPPTPARSCGVLLRP